MACEAVKAPSVEVDGPATTRSPSLLSKAPPCPSTGRRRVRAALALVEQATATARRPHLSLTERARAVEAARGHLAAAWAALVSWSVEGGELAEIGRASALLGGINRHLPLLAASLRAEAGAALSFDKEAA